MGDKSKINILLTELSNKFENKRINKKNDISGDFTDDNCSYPTVRALKNWVNILLEGKSEIGHTHDDRYYTESETDTKLGTKVDKVTGKGLSSNDYTDSEKEKLSGIEERANNYTHPSYTARTGKPTSNQTPSFGGTATVSQINSDGTGHITGATNRTIKIPDNLGDGTNKGLTTNDYTTNEKNKLAGIAENANNYTHPNSGVTAGTNQSSNQTPDFNSNFNIPKLTFDAKGHITGSDSSTVKIPALPSAGTSTAGIVQLENSYNSSSTTKAPTSKALKDGLATKAPNNHNQETSTITNTTALDNILPGESITLTLTDQAKVNSALNDIIGTLKGLKFLEITSNKGTASASTMNKLYIVPENSKVNVYYTKENNGSYSWKKLDDDILDELNISWNDVTGKPDIPTKTSDLQNDGDDGTNVFIKNNDSRLSDARTPTSHTHGNLQNDGTVGTSNNASKNVVTDSNGKITTEDKPTIPQLIDSYSSSATDKAPTSKALKDGLATKAPNNHNQETSTITNTTALDNILPGESITLTLTDQAKVNSALNDIIGTLKGLKFLEITSNKGTASASTMNKLYIVPENSKVNVYYTKENNGSYSWKKLDDDILDELNISWNDVTGKPDIPTKTSDLQNDGDDGTNVFIKNNDSRLSDARTPTSHTHGNLQNDGTVGTSNNASKNVVTDSNGKITTEDKPTIPQLIDSYSSSATDKAPTSKALKDGLATKVDTVSIIGTFTELGNEITNAITNNNGILILNRDYKRVSSDSQISSQLTSNLVIIGNGHTIDCNTLGRFLYINTNVKVELNDLKIINGLYTNQGGAIYVNTGSCVLNKCEITNNQVTSGAGGAIFTNSSLIVNDCIFNKNTSNGSGGAIRLYEGELTVKNTIFDNNSANNGAGIHARVGGFTVINCEFKNNIATGNVYSSIYSSNSTNTVINCTIPLNTSYRITNKLYLTDLPTLNKDTISFNKLVCTDNNNNISTIKKGIENINILQGTQEFENWIEEKTGSATYTTNIDETYMGCKVKYLKNNYVSTLEYDADNYVQTKLNFDYNQLELNNYYVLSFWAKSSTNNSNFRTFLYRKINSKRIQLNSSTGDDYKGSATSFNNGETYIDLTTEWKRYYIVYLLDSAMSSDVNTESIVFRLNSSTSEIDIKIAGVKLEKGLIPSAWSLHPSDVNTAVSGKVDKVTGKGLSTNDYTTTEKDKLANISENAKNVSYSATKTSGTEIGRITIDNTETVIYQQDNNTYNRCYQTTQIVANGALNTGTIICGSTDNKYVTVASGAVFDIRYPILFLNSNVADGGSSNNVDSQRNNVDIQNTVEGKTVTTNKKVYVKGTLNGNQFTIHSDVFVSDDNLTDGFDYVCIGTSYSNHQIRFNTFDMTVYHYSTANGLIPIGYNHGNITADGKIGSVSDKLVVTGTGGLIITSDMITEWNSVIESMIEYVNSN